MKRNPLQRCAEARELLEVDLTCTVVQSLLLALQLEHPTLDRDFDPLDPPSLCLARDILPIALQLRNALSHYRDAVEDSLSSGDDGQLPF